MDIPRSGAGNRAAAGGRGSCDLLQICLCSAGLLSPRRESRQSAARGHPWYPDFLGTGSSVHQKEKQPFGMCGTMPDSSRPTSPAGPRTARKTDLLVCSAEFVCSSWCCASLRLSISELRPTTAQLRRTLLAAVANKFRRLSVRGPSGELPRQMVPGREKHLPTSLSSSDATHEPPS